METPRVTEISRQQHFHLVSYISASKKSWRLSISTPQPRNSQSISAAFFPHLPRYANDPSLASGDVDKLHFNARYHRFSHPFFIYMRFSRCREKSPRYIPPQELALFRVINIHFITRRVIFVVVQCDDDDAFLIKLCYRELSLEQFLLFLCKRIKGIGNFQRFLC